MLIPNSKPMVFGLDWDGTVTRDPDTMAELAHLLKDAGHKVYIVTMRYASECGDLLKESVFMDAVEGVVPTARRAKDAAMKSLGIKVDVWIDDNPRAVNERAMQIWGSESPEGEVWVETGDGVVMVKQENAGHLIDPYKKLLLPKKMRGDVDGFLACDLVDSQPTLNTQGLMYSDDHLNITTRSGNIDLPKSGDEPPYVPMDVPV